MLALVDTVPTSCVFVCDAFYDTDLCTYLMLTQTSERMWEVGFVSKVPWRENRSY